jgi:hypothetical protein
VLEPTVLCLGAFEGVFGLFTWFVSYLLGVIGLVHLAIGFGHWAGG